MNESTSTFNSVLFVPFIFSSYDYFRIAPYSISPAQGGMTYVPVMPPRPNRSSPFDDSILSDGLQNAYGAGLGAVPQGWGYGPATDAYGNISNLSQGRPSGPYPGQIGGQFRHPPPHYGALYGGHFGFPTCGTAASPGPPIQTTSSNKGPDGANLFIFHIPNHFGNFDMYNMFSPYGNLLSVRIMVEKDSGRSRGFGFVSYDNPDSAALAIKELNGFAVSLALRDRRTDRDNNCFAYCILLAVPKSNSFPSRIIFRVVPLDFYINASRLNKYRV